MDKKEKIKERTKIIAGCAGALVLLGFIFYMAWFSRAVGNQKDSNGVLKDLRQTKVYSLVESGKTEWKYLDTGMVRASGEGTLDWTGVSYDDSAWKSEGGSFGAVNGKLQEQVDHRLPRNLLNHFQSNGSTIPVY